MNVSTIPVDLIVKESNRQGAFEHLSRTELNKELSRLSGLRDKARRLNEEAFQSAWSSAEAKAPALVLSNAMMSRHEIEDYRRHIQLESQVISSQVLTRLCRRIELCAAQIVRLKREDKPVRVH